MAPPPNKRVKCEHYATMHAGGGSRSGAPSGQVNNAAAGAAGPVEMNKPIRFDLVYTAQAREIREATDETDKVGKSLRNHGAACLTLGFKETKLLR